jgi:hypothetical protein
LVMQGVIKYRNLSTPKGKIIGMKANSQDALPAGFCELVFKKSA